MAQIQIIQAPNDRGEYLSIEIAGVEKQLQLTPDTFFYFTGIDSYWKAMRRALENIHDAKVRAAEARQAMKLFVALKDDRTLGRETDEHPFLKTTGLDHLSIPLSDLAAILMEAEPSRENADLYRKFLNMREEMGFQTSEHWGIEMKTIAEIAFSGQHHRRTVPEDETLARGYFLRGRFLWGQGQRGQALGCFEEAAKLDGGLRAASIVLKNKYPELESVPPAPLLSYQPANDI